MGSQRKPGPWARITVSPILQSCEAFFIANEAAGNPRNVLGINDGSTAAAALLPASGIVWAAGEDGSPALKTDGASLATFDATGLPSLAGPMTIICRVHIDSVSSHGTFVKVGGSSDGVAIGIGSSTHEDNGNNLIVVFENIAWLNTGKPLSVGWHTVAVLGYSSDFVSVYLDGQFAYSQSISNYLAAGASRSIGGSPASGSRYFTGSVSWWGVWRRTLNPAEIFALSVDPFQIFTISRDGEIARIAGVGTVYTLSVDMSGGNPVLTWSAASGATSYNVLRAATATGPYTVIASGVALLTYEDMAPLSTGYYSIVAVGTTSGVTLSVDVSGASPVLTWTAHAGASTYNVLRATSVTGPYTVIASALAALTYTDTTPEYGVNYYAVVPVL